MRHFYKYENKELNFAKIVISDMYWSFEWLEVDKNRDENLKETLTKMVLIVSMLNIFFLNKFLKFHNLLC